MNRFLGLWLALTAAPLMAAEPELIEAQTRLLRGNYAEAAAAYEKLAAAGNGPTAFVGWARALMSQGEYDKASQILNQGVQKYAHDSDLLARQAELHYLRGQWAQAEKAADAALEQNTEHFLARWVKAELLRDRGELEKADEAFRWFVRTYTQRSNDCKDVTDAERIGDYRTGRRRECQRPRVERSV